MNVKSNRIKSITTEELKHAYKTAAHIVALYGDKYLPGFQRLHDELEARTRLSDIKSVALRVANESILG